MKNYITIKRVLMVILSIILTVNIYSQNKKIFFNSDHIQVLKVESFDSIRKGNDYIILMCGSSLSDTSIISIDKKIVQASLRKNISEDQEEVKHKNNYVFCVILLIVTIIFCYNLITFKWDGSDII